MKKPYNSWNIQVCNVNFLRKMFHGKYIRIFLPFFYIFCVSLFGWIFSGEDVHAQNGVQYLHNGVIPPGETGARRLIQGNRAAPTEGYYQPVEIRTPRGALISVASDGTFIRSQRSPQIYGFLIGRVYRLRITGIHLHPGLELYPTLELIDRTHPPRGEELRHPIVVDITQEDLEFAADCKMVTRIIYIEDPRNAMPIAEKPWVGQGFFDVNPGDDPLAVADSMGRPVAILRIGIRAPQSEESGKPLASGDMPFLFNCPPFLHYVPNLEEKSAATVKSVLQDTPTVGTTDPEQTGNEAAPSSGTIPVHRMPEVHPDSGMPVPHAPSKVIPPVNPEIIPPQLPPRVPVT